MKPLFSTIPALLILSAVTAQADNAGMKAPAVSGYEISHCSEGFFDTDSIPDLLVIYSCSSERSCSSQKAIIYQQTSDKKLIRIYECDHLFPETSFTGRSDNLFDTLTLEPQRIVWRTCVAPHFSSTYSVQTYTFTFNEPLNGFTLTKFTEELFPSPETVEPIHLTLHDYRLTDANKALFDINLWMASDYPWTEKNVFLAKDDFSFWNKLSSEMEEHRLFSNAIRMQQTLLVYFPEKKEIWKKLGDLYWEDGSKKQGAECYKRYLQETGKKPPRYIRERLPE